MKPKQIVNMAWMQALWFAAVMGAAVNLTWPALAVLAGFAIWQLFPANRICSDLAMIPVAVFIGFILDSNWIRLGWIEYSNPGKVPGLAPYWILILWAGLALTLNHSLAWMRSKPLMTGLITTVVSPLSYLGGESLGGLKIINDSWHWVVGLGVSWGIALPLLLWLADHLREIKQGDDEEILK